MLPTVFGFNSAVRDTTTETVHSCRFSRFCHTNSFSAAKLPARRARSLAVGSLGLGVDWARAGVTPPPINRKPMVPTKHAGRRPNMYAIVPFFVECENY